jgi:Mg-chelatase subunit ChlD
MSDSEKCFRSNHRVFSRWLLGVLGAVALICTFALSFPASAQEGLPGTYGFKIYHVSSLFYPYVQVYFRTFDQQMEPLVNLNERNVGLMVAGRSYDPMKRQYGIQSLRVRQEAARTVIVLDASRSMAGRPFEAALQAVARYIDSKRSQDEVAILAIRDTKTGYDVVSGFERDGGALGRRLADVKADGRKTRLYDAIGAALQMCGGSSEGSVTPANASFVVSNSIVVFSDGKDEGSAVSRADLNTRISTMSIPIPIYSLAYSKIKKQHFINLEALSKNSFGKYFLIGEAYKNMQRVVEEIQNIIQSDYVVTFRSYIPVDGEEHAFKIGVEYPSGSGKYTYQSGKFEAFEPPPSPALKEKIDEIGQVIPALDQGDTPYFQEAQPARPIQPMAPGKK